MAEEPKMVPREDSPNCKYISVETDGPRALMEPHYTIVAHRLIAMLPSTGVQFGTMVTEASGAEIGVLTLVAVQSYGLSYLMLPDEMRALGESMIQMADEIDGNAKSAFDAVMERVRKPGTPDAE